MGPTRNVRRVVGNPGRVFSPSIPILKVYS
jgi:hypothetical protein